MGVEITSPLVTIRPVKNRMADSGGVLTRILVTLWMCSARSPCETLPTFAH